MESSVVAADGVIMLLIFEYVMFFFVLAMLIAIVTSSYDKAEHPHMFHESVH